MNFRSIIPASIAIITTPINISLILNIIPYKLIVKMLPYNANFYRNSFSNVNFIDNCNLCNTNFIRCIGWLDINFINDNSYTKMDDNTFLKFSTIMINFSMKTLNM